jgi:hypothetical protein
LIEYRHFCGNLEEEAERRLFPDVSFSSSLACYVVYRAENASLARLAAFRNG